MRTDVAAIHGERGVESVFEWGAGALSGSGLLVGVAVSVGMAAVSLGHVVVLSRIWMGLAAGWDIQRAEQCCGRRWAGGGTGCDCGALAVARDVATGADRGCGFAGACEQHADGLLQAR